MKTKLVFFAVIFITSLISWSSMTYATQTILPGTELTPDSFHYFCGDENDSIIAYAPESAATMIYWKFETTGDIIFDVDSIIITVDSIGLWSFYSDETGYLYFSVYITSAMPYEPANFEDENICTFSFSRILDAQNTESYSTYLWSNGATTRTISVDAPGIYTVTITNTCGDMVFSKTITQNNPNAPNLGPDQEFCLGETATLNPQSTDVIYTLWSTGSEDSQLVVEESGTYWVHIEDENGCNGRDTINITIIQTPSQEILIATINTDPLDPKYGNNMITWNVDPLLVDIDSVYIYREMGTNNYVLVGGTEYEDGEWSDEVNSIPHAWKYKISLVGNPCGESVFSSSVQTIHSWVSEYQGNYTIQWDPYIVDSKTTVTWYKILSGNGLNELTVRDSVSGSLTSVTLPSTTDSIFVVGAELNGAKNFSGLALSNKTYNPTVTRISTEVIAPTFSLYPNPAYDELNINNIGHKDFHVEVSTLLGQVVLTEYNVKTLNISSLPQGIYIISVSADGITTNEKFFKY